jgi:hypothetical protein
MVKFVFKLQNMGRGIMERASGLQGDKSDYKKFI